MSGPVRQNRVIIVTIATGAERHCCGYSGRRKAARIAVLLREEPTYGASVQVEQALGADQSAAVR
jgi:hypothetical protein